MEERAAVNAGIDRRRFLVRTAGAGAALSGMGVLLAACGGSDEQGAATAAGGGGAERVKIRWISPRGSLDVMDDYPLWVAIKLGYFEQLDVDVEMLAGSTDATAAPKLIAQDQADMGFPSPGVLTASIQSGIEVISVWQQYPAQVFDFAVAEGSAIAGVGDLAGKSISLPSAGASVVVDPLLVEAGVDPKSVKYVEGGAQWGQVVAQGKADAALAWEGLRAQWLGQGLKLRFLLGSDFSAGPSNSYVVRSADLDDASLSDGLGRFFQAIVMASEFAKANPRAAAQITYEERPALAETLSPQLALDSMLQLASGYGATARAGKGWGYHDEAAWSAYIDALVELGQLKQAIPVDEVVTNRFVKPANADADVEKAKADAEGYELSGDFGATSVPAGSEL